MADPSWFKNIDAGERAEYAEELARLLKYTAELKESPAKDFKATGLGKAITYWFEPKPFHRLASALLLAIEGSREADDLRTTVVLAERLSALLRRNLPFSADEMTKLLVITSSLDSFELRLAMLSGVAGTIQRMMVSRPLAAEHREALLKFRQELIEADASHSKKATQLAEQIEKLCDDSTAKRLHADDGWADDLREWIASLPSRERGKWEAFLRAVAAVQPEPPATAWTVGLTGPVGGLNSVDFDRWRRLQLERVPSTSWRQKVAQHIEALGRAKVTDRLRHWLHAVPRSKPGMLARACLNRELMRGFLWLAVELASAELAAAVQRATQFFHERKSGLAEAGVAALYQMPDGIGASSLANLARRATGEGHLAYLTVAVTAAAERLGVEPEDLEDTAMPTFGFKEYGRLARDFGDVRALLRIDGDRSAKINWARADGKELKTVPARVKRDYADEVEALKSTMAEVHEALSDLTRRLEASWLTERTYQLADWRERLIDHPVAGVIGRSLIWRFSDGKKPLSARFSRDKLVDVNGSSVRLLNDTTIALWHPLNVPADEVLAWRIRLEDEEVTQPFKQAHREVYVLTDAERQTGTFSNRFAAHIIRQAQFRRLAKLRRWKVGLIGPWDSGASTPERTLTHWKLRAEFWVSGAGGDSHPGYIYLSTDQVRFYRLGSQDPLPLTDIPPLVFSEIMRDVDLFVGVCSVANDPNWADGGPEGRYRDYWESYSFGDLSATAQTRKAVLQSLVPRLSIGPRCSFEEKFLVVRGDLRTYKIHLGSGNILMAPNDQYLCIVPKQSAGAGDKRIYLPFEGDSTLAVILSKAFLLAEDAKIKDASIVSQIKGTR